MEVPLNRIEASRDFMPSDSGNESEEMHDFSASNSSNNASSVGVPPSVAIASNPFPKCVPRPSWTSRLWRSVPMSRARVFVERDQAYSLVSRLGVLGCVQFVDLNAGLLFNERAFAHDVVACDEVDRKLRALRGLLRLRGVRIPRVVLQLDQEELDLDSLAGQSAEELQAGVNGLSGLERSHEELSELLMLLGFVQTLLQQQSSQVLRASQEQAQPVPLMDDDDFDDPEQQQKGSFIAAVGVGKSLSSFERVVWRATRGNSLVCHQAEGEKVCIVIWFTSATVERKIRKLCDAFSYRVYHVPPIGLQELQIEISGRIAELSLVLERSEARLREQMEELASHLFSYEVAAAQRKATFHALNLFQHDRGRKVLMGEFWVPTARCDELLTFVRQSELSDSVKTVVDLNPGSDGGEDESDRDDDDDGHGNRLDMQPPTLMDTNRFTKAFNSVVETYAVASYAEVNPAVFTIVTFPFLFGLMFGDVGHGLMLLLGTLGVIAFEGRLGRMSKDELGQFGTIFRARYLMLLMGCSAIYMGFIYNEFYALPMNLQNSAWYPVPNNSFLQKANWTFPFGVDPVWKVSENELQFYNSLKMKASIILAYFHMMLGIVMQAFNAVHFRKKYDFYFEFIPRATFLTSIIGYMVLLIFVKWGRDWSLVQPFAPNMSGNGASAAPYIIGIMTNFFLKPLDTTPSIDCMYMLGCSFQPYFQFFLLVLAVACVPVMLVRERIHTEQLAL